jgi:hypothetical protein
MHALIAPTIRCFYPMTKLTKPQLSIGDLAHARAWRGDGAPVAGRGGRFQPAVKGAILIARVVRLRHLREPRTMARDLRLGLILIVAALSLPQAAVADQT